MPASVFSWDVIKADNADNLNLGSSWWVESRPPPAMGGVEQHYRGTRPEHPLLGADTNPAGIRIANPIDAVTISAGNISDQWRLGIDMSAATTN